jgi:hypothetical protein
MATLTITNLSSTEALPITELYTTIAAGATITCEREPNEIPAMRTLQEALNEQKATLSVTYSAAEIGSGLVLDQGAPVTAAAVLSGTLMFRVALAADVGGTPDDTPIFGIGDMPANYRLVDGYIVVSVAGGGGSTLTVEDELAGAGVQYLTYSTAATGRVEMDATITALPLAVRGATKGLILRRSDNTAALEVVLIARPELG